MKVIQSTKIKLSEIEVNRGQIEGLPANPRFIIDEKFEKLKQSIQENPDMLPLRELLVYRHGAKYVIIGGNMRYRAMKELGYKEAPCKIIPKETSIEDLRAYTLKDNSTFGTWDFEQLTVWNPEELDAWDLELPDRPLDFDELTDDFELDNDKADDDFTMSFFVQKEQAEYIEQTLERQINPDTSEALMKIIREWTQKQ
jgi:hypothetical protein